MTARTDGERLAVLEAGMTNIQSDITQLRAEVAVLTKSVDQLVRSKLEDHAVMTNSLANLTGRVTKIEGQNRPLNRWFTHTLSAIVGAILLLLITNYLQNL